MGKKSGFCPFVNFCSTEPSSSVRSVSCIRLLQLNPSLHQELRICALTWHLLLLYLMSFLFKVMLVSTGTVQYPAPHPEDHSELILLVFIRCKFRQLNSSI